MWTVVSLGGSLLVPDGIDAVFLGRFAGLVRRLLDGGARFVVVVGGGRTARTYQEAGRAVGEVRDEDLDWLGIHATRLNAHLLRTVFADVASPRIITDPVEDPLPADARLVIGAGWKPGRSTDYDAAVLAGRVGAARIVNLSNVSHVYAEDPRKNPAAERFDALSWDGLLAITGTEWTPGLNAPFDPVAARLCREKGLSVAILSAASFENVEAALRGEPFEGTVVG